MTKTKAPSFSAFGEALHKGKCMKPSTKVGIAMAVLASVGSVAVWAIERAIKLRKLGTQKSLLDSDLDDRLEQSMDASDAVAKF